MPAVDDPAEPTETDPADDRRPSLAGDGAGRDGVEVAAAASEATAVEVLGGVRALGLAVTCAPGPAEDFFVTEERAGDAAGAPGALLAALPPPPTPPPAVVACFWDWDLRKSVLHASSAGTLGPRGFCGCCGCGCCGCGCGCGC